MKQRLKWLDVARGIGMLFVVVGHAIPSIFRSTNGLMKFLYEYIFYFHMPFMYLLSGYGYRINENRYRIMENKKYIIKKIKSFIVPYLAYATLVFLIFEIMNVIPKLGSAMSDAGYGSKDFFTFLHELLIGNNSFCIHLWYIYALFVFEILTFFLVKIKYGKQIMILLSIVLMYISVNIDVMYSMAWSNGARMYICFVVGLMLPLEKIKGKKTLIFLMIWNLTFYLSKIMRLSKINLNYEFIFWIINFIFATAALVGIAQWISGKLQDVFEYLGKHSMLIYLFHQPFWGSCIGTLLYGVLGINIYLVFVLSICLSFLMPIIIYKLFGKMKFMNVLFGVK